MDPSSHAITNVLASISLLVSCTTAFFVLRDRRHARFKTESEYVNALLGWHGSVVLVLLRLRLAGPEVVDTKRQEDLAQLSALIEQGRFFFPNIDRGDAFGNEKPPAYRGYRNLALDMLVASYNVLEKVPTGKGKTQAERLQRHFTSIVYEIVRPHGRLETIKALTDRYFAQHKSFEDFLDHEDPSAIEHIWRGRRRKGA